MLGSKVRVAINGSLYEMGRDMASAAKRTAREALKGKYAIYAIEKNNVIEMLREEYPTEKELTASMRAYKRKGFMVSYVKA